MGVVSIEGITKGKAVLAHSAISATTTSEEIEIMDYNAIFLSTDITGSGTWKIDVQGKLAPTETYMDLYDNNDNQLTTGNLTASRIKLFVPVPDYIKIVATEVVNGSTCTVIVKPLNV